MTDYMRIWQEVDIAEIQAHIVVVDDKFGFCPGCREIGIKLEGLHTCPSCGREFKYVTSRDKTPAMVMRTRKKLPGLAFVDYDDYERLTGKKKAETLFKNIEE
jgi:uncharacterized Zn finger protein (UPF0148 family)